MNTVRQLGSNSECARKECGHAPQFRVILGRWHVQIYICSSHLAWGVSLGMIRETTGDAMGWDRKDIRVIKPTQVEPLLSKIIKTDFGRDVAAEIGERYPQFRDGSGIPHFRPVREEESA